MTPSLVRNFGPGFICWWHSFLGSIPSGFVLCNGENGTPNLLDQVIYGAGTTPVGENLGSVNHNHDFTSADHTARWDIGGTEVANAPNFDEISLSNAGTGKSNNVSSLPPFHGLLPIMEL